jgi:hypothetical protein
MSSLMRKNDRREVRKAIKMKCHVVRERDFSLIAEETVDVSPDGMLVKSDLPDLEPGERVFVTFRATNLDIWFDTEASVMRIIKGRRDGDRERGIGLRFSTLPGVKRLILRGHLRRVPPPLPRRAQRIDWTATVRSIVA